MRASAGLPRAIVLCALSTCGAAALAQTAQPAPAVAPAAAAETAPAAPTPGITFGPDISLVGNASIISDYRFRGFTQTGYRPAFQGGVDFSHPSGFYVGNWNSNVEQGLYRGASLEMDFYGGYKYTFLDDFTADVGYYYYYYPTKRSQGTYQGYGRQAREGEAYVGLTWKFVSVKYWYATTNYFGLGDSFQGSREIDTDGSSYAEINLSYDLGGGWGVLGHYGLQSIHNHGQFTNTNGDPLSSNVGDWKVGATKDLAGWVLGVSVIGTTRKEYFGTSSFEAGGKTRVLGSVSKTF